MKTLQQLSFLALALIFILSSCTNGKKIRMSGNLPDRSENHHTPFRYDRPTEFSKGNATVPNDGYERPAYTEKESTITYPEQHSKTIHSMDKSKLGKSINSIPSETKTPSVQKLKKITKALQYKNKFDSEGERGGFAMLIVGLLLIALGYLFYGVLGTVFGPIFFMIFGIAGLIYALIGLIKILSGS